ncbi:MAG: hypothetical protein M1840_001257 [Geoglossum simile]|nr:MAG: hypothetical protein M1840_001257 [Geoglossum simile]
MEQSIWEPFREAIERSRLPLKAILAQFPSPPRLIRVIRDRGDRARWPNPTESIGQTQYQALPGGRLLWEAAGHARQQLEPVLQRICDILSENPEYLSRREQASCSTGVGLYMVGTRRDTAQPTIIIRCSNKRVRERAIEFIRANQVLAHYEGVLLEGTRQSPEALAGEEAMTMEHIQLLEDSGLVYIGQQTSNPCGALVLMRIRGRNRWATMGGVVVIDDVYYGMTASHAGAWTANDNGGPPDDNIEPNTELSLEHEPVLALGSNSSSQGAANTGNAPGANTYFVGLGTRLDDSWRNDDLDWELFRIDNDCYKLPNKLPPPYQNISPRWPPLAPPLDQDVLAITGTKGAIRGRISGTPFFLRMPGRTRFQKTWVVSLEKRPTRGDCGSWIVGSNSGDIYGHIIAGEEDVAYIAPLTQMSDDMTKLGRRIVIKTEEPSAPLISPSVVIPPARGSAAASATASHTSNIRGDGGALPVRTSAVQSNTPSSTALNTTTSVRAATHLITGHSPTTSQGISAALANPQAKLRSENVRQPKFPGIFPEQRLVLNPLQHRTAEQVAEESRTFHRKNLLDDIVHEATFVRAALAARDEHMAEIDGITYLENTALQLERAESTFQRYKRLPSNFYLMLATCCLLAITQGWDQASINGANLGWPKEFHLKVDLASPQKHPHDVWLFSIVNASAYLSAAIYGMGVRASVAPLFLADMAAGRHRGNLVVLWQLFVALGSFLGFSANLVVFDSWRRMILAAFIPALLTLVLVPFCTETPQWLMKRGRYREALRIWIHLYGEPTPLLACRDLYYLHAQIQKETRYIRQMDEGIPLDEGGVVATHDEAQSDFKVISYQQQILLLFKTPRSRRAVVSAFVVMVTQQTCGFNIFAFLSSTIFNDEISASQGSATNNLSKDLYAQKKALWISFGFGLANFAFAGLAWGRRYLLHWSFPNMAWTLLSIGFCFLVKDKDARQGLIIFFVLLFTMAYSAGEGPVAFVLSSEVFPFMNREAGMSIAVFSNFLGAGILALTVPNSVYALTYTGLFGLFASLNILAWVVVFFFVPETAEEELEALNLIFEIPTWMHIKYQLETLRWFFRQRSEKPEPIYIWAKKQPATSLGQDQPNS